MEDLYSVPFDPMDYRKADRQVQRKPFVLGYTEEFYSKELKENRVLNIYLPDGYREGDTVRYPVIFLLDGAADEDFIHIVGLLQYNNFPWIDRVPKSIVVGIANVNRRRDFTFPTTVAEDKKLWPATGGSAAFIRFMKKELQPYVESRYRTGGGRTLIGQSLGGLLATQILFEKPAMFDRYIIVSPSLWWDNGSMLQRIPAVAGARDLPFTQVYIGVGKEGLTPGKNPRVMEDDAKLLVGKLNAIGHPSLKIFFDYLPAEDHATVTHPAVFNAFRLLYPVKVTQ
ncbi:esterase [Flavihumibacter stibioxidans]|uniref:Esterase n=2 Tax=Flavihumibacter stibioxidans TaxID=1834163 RepID=A0ABR7MAM2_9BACT|nr:esterase [Flavihumibacter stibioxidans]